MLKTTVIALGLLVASSLYAADFDGPLYVGELIDGTKVKGQELKNLKDAPSLWKLDNTQLFGDTPLRWLKKKLPPGSAPVSFVEFRNGDLLPGDVSRYFAANANPQPVAIDPSSPEEMMARREELMLRRRNNPQGNVLTLPNVGFSTPSPWNDPYLSVTLPAVADSPDAQRIIRRTGRAATARMMRIDPAQVRRIVWQRQSNEVFTPKTIYYRDGRSINYRSLRWEETGVKILSEQGPATIPFDEIAELHLDASDPWADYAQQLARIMPELHGRLAQFEMQDGARYTGSTDRFQMLGAIYSGAELRRIEMVNGRQQIVPNERMSYLQGVQPVWAIDPISLEVDKIRSRRYFGLHEVPLSALAPAAIRQSSSLARGWGPQIDHNVQGGPLVNAGTEYGWGWGVHAWNRLEFDLPPFARTFQTKLGLDAAAGKGGCAKGIVSVTSGGEQTLFTSPVFVGSKDGADSGPMELPDFGKSDRKLMLLADPLLKDYPEGADPLEIGDVLDWLEPLVVLDPPKLREQVTKYTAEKTEKKATPNPLRDALEKVAPGFEWGQPDVRVHVLSPGMGTTTLVMQPNAGSFPQLLRRLVEVPAQKVTKLKVATIATAGIPWTLVVLANGTPIGPTAAHPPEKKDLAEIDLTPFAGRRIALEIDAAQSLQVQFTRIEIVSTDPPPADDKKPDEKKPNADK